MKYTFIDNDSNYSFEIRKFYFDFSNSSIKMKEIVLIQSQDNKNIFYKTVRFSRNIENKLIQ